MRHINETVQRAAAAMSMEGKLPGWQRPSFSNVIISGTPVMVALHFKNAAARIKAGRVVEAIKLAGDKLTGRQVDTMLSPFVNRVPIYRGALKSVEAATVRAIARMEKANVTQRSIQK